MRKTLILTPFLALAWTTGAGAVMFSLIRSRTRRDGRTGPECEVIPLPGRLAASAGRPLLKDRAGKRPAARFSSMRVFSVAPAKKAGHPIYMNNVAARFIDNARNLGHSSHVAAWAIEAVTGQRAHSLCCWCAEPIEGDAVRLPAGGECSRCPYVGPDCLVIIPPAAPVITAREFYSKSEGRTLFMADGPDATSKSLLARTTPEAAIADGLAYFLRTRAQNTAGDWTIVA